MDVTPEIKTSVGDSSENDPVTSPELETKHDFTQKSLVFEPELKLPRSSKYYEKPLRVRVNRDDYERSHTDLRSLCRWGLSM